MKLGFSLSPEILRNEAQNPHEAALLGQYGGISAFLAHLKGEGINSIELRAVSPREDPVAALRSASAVWEAGMEISIHGALPDEIVPFSECFTSLLPLLEKSPAHQECVTLVLHAYSSASDTDTDKLAIKTNEILKLWAREAQKYSFRIALENNRIKKTNDPSVTCAGVSGIISDIEAPYAGICFDFGHYYFNMSRVCFTPHILPPESFVRRVVHTHIHAIGENGTHMPLCSDTEMPLKTYISALKAMGYNGTYNLELSFDRFTVRDYKEAVTVSIRALREAAFENYDRFKNGRDALRTYASDNYPAEIRRITDMLLNPDPRYDECFYMLNVSGMLFRSCGCLFAVDPAIRTDGERNASAAELRALFSHVSYIFVTHHHGDHFDPDLAALISDLPCKWVIPSCVPADYYAYAKLPPEKCIFVSPDDVVSFSGLSARVMDGHHRQPDGYGLDGVSYLINAGGRTIFIPSDVRNYDPAGFDKIDPPDVMFANVWLGRSLAQVTPEDYFNQFCDFVAHFKPARVYLAHMYEYMRPLSDMWAYSHCGEIMDGLAARMPRCEVMPTHLFARYSLL